MMELLRCSVFIDDIHTFTHTRTHTQAHCSVWGCRRSRFGGGQHAHGTFARSQ